MTRSIRDSIAHYIDDHFMDGAWVESLCVEHGVATVLDGCVDILATQNPDDVHQVLTFLRDIGLGAFGVVTSSGEQRAAIRDPTLVSSARGLMPATVLPALRRLLSAPHLTIRTNAIFTIGKLCFGSEMEALRQAASTFLDGDPICLARLVGELSWLNNASSERNDQPVERQSIWALVDRMAAHESYLIRWSCLGIGSPIPEPLLHKLSTDPVPCVREEATHRLAWTDLEIAGTKASWQPKAEWRKRRALLGKAAPRIRFEMLENALMRELARSGRTDYWMDELEAVVQMLSTTAGSAT